MFVVVAVGFAVGGDMRQLRGMVVGRCAWKPDIRRVANFSPESSRPSNAMARELGPS